MQIASVSIKTSLNLAQVKKDLADIEKLAQGVGIKLGVKIGADVGKGIRSQKSSIESAFTGIFQGVGIQITNLLTNAIGAGIKGIFGSIGSSIKASTDLRNVTNALEFLSGSSAGARTELAYLRAEADRLKLPLEVLRKGYLGLFAASRQTALQGVETRNIFSAIAQASRVYNLDSEQLKGALLALQQVMSKGKVSAEELRQQLGERLYGAFQISARSIGITTTELDKLLRTGKLLATDFLPRFARQLAAETAGGVAGAMESVTAKTGELGNRLLDLKERFGGAIEPAILSGLDLISQTLMEVGNSSGLFDTLNQRALQFRDYLKQNPQIARQIGIALNEGVVQVLDFASDTALDLLNHLKENPQAIKEMAESMRGFLTMLTESLRAMTAIFDAVKGVVEYIGRGSSVLSERTGANNINLRNNPQANSLAYLDRLGFLESDQNPNADNGIARGAFQFTAPTAEDAVKAGIPDPREGTYSQQREAAWRFIRHYHPEAAQAVLSGNFDAADNLLRSRWVSLPGGSEPQSSARYQRANAMLPQSGSAGIATNRIGIGSQRGGVLPQGYSVAGAQQYTSLDSELPPIPGVNGEQQMVFPVQGRSLENQSSGFGMRTHPVTGQHRMHNGIDIPAPRGTNVLAPLDGVITRVAPNNGAAGNMVEMDVIVDGKVQTLQFMHLDSIMAERGQQVSAGTQIGTVGSTGRSTGNHLHFGVREGGQYRDPRAFLNGAVAGEPTLENMSATVNFAIAEAERQLQERRSNEQAIRQQQRQQRDQELEVARAEEDARLAARIAEAENPYQRSALENEQDQMGIRRTNQDQVTRLGDQRADLVAARTAKIQDGTIGGVDYSAAIAAIDQLIQRTTELQELQLQPSIIEQQREIAAANEELDHTYQGLIDSSSQLFSNFANDTPLGRHEASVRAIAQSHTELSESIREAIEEQNHLIEVEGETEANKERLLNLNRMLLETQLSLGKATERETQAYREQNAELKNRFRSYSDQLQLDSLNAQSGLAESRGDSEGASRLSNRAAQLSEMMRFSSQISEINQMRTELSLTNNEFNSLIGLATELNQVNLEGINGQFDSIGKTIATGLQPIVQNVFSSIIKGSFDAKDALGQLVDMFLNFALNSIFNSIFGSMFGGGGGGLLGGLVLPGKGGLGGILPGFADGGVVHSPTIASIGERGSEAIVPLKNGAIPVMMSGGRGGGEVTEYINIEVHVESNGNIRSSTDRGTKTALALKNAIVTEMAEQRRHNGILND